MKTHRFDLAFFIGSESDDSGNFYVDWPAIHRQAGLDHVKWIQQQDNSKCQIVLERRPNDYYIRAVVEIYSDELAMLYAIMWAK